MKTSQVSTLLGLCAAGFLGGYAGHRAFPSAAIANELETRQPAAAPTRESRVGPEAPTPSRRPTAKPAASTLKSTDTLETLAALDDKSLYARLALWMVDASEQDIAAYWQSYRQKAHRDNDINDLIFIHWTRLNPAGAIAAAAGSKDEHYAWWAWSCHDPKAALSAAIAQNPDRINNVTWGIGEFHPEWLRKHFDEIPESGRDNAFEGLAKWDDYSDPLEILKFLKEKGKGAGEGLFQTLARRDPWAAYDWFQENGGRNGELGTFISTVGESNPEVLQRIADQTAPGEMKRKFEAAVFESLVKSDPEAAMKQALETKAPIIATERLATVGLSLVSTDPDKAFELAEKMFEKNPEALTLTTTIRYENGSSSSGGNHEVSTRFITSLLAEDPDRVMSMASSPSQIDGKAKLAFVSLANSWAVQDVKGYADWVNRQTNPVVREPAEGTLIDRLENNGNYSEAAEWTMSLKQQSRDLRLSSLMRSWRDSSPEEARLWLESANLPDVQKQSLGKLLESP